MWTARAIPFVLIFLACAPPPVGARQVQPFALESAYHEGTAITFVPSVRLDWAELAPAELRSLPVPSSDPAVIARYAPRIDMFGGVEIETAVPAPTELAVGSLYFVGADGITAMELDSTRVVTRLDFDRTGTRLEARRSWGVGFGAPEGTPEGGGFVLRSELPLDFRPQPAAFTADDLFLGTDPVPGRAEERYCGQGTSFWGIVSQHRFSVDGHDGEWLFVQWEADRDLF